MKNRPTFRIWDKKLRKWYHPIYEAWQGRLDDLFLTPSGDLVRHRIGGIDHESLFPNRYKVVLDTKKKWYQFWK